MPSIGLLVVVVVVVLVVVFVWHWWWWVVVVLVVVGGGGCWVAGAGCYVIGDGWSGAGVLVFPPKLKPKTQPKQPIVYHCSMLFGVLHSLYRLLRGFRCCYTAYTGSKTKHSLHFFAHQRQTQL